MRQLQLTYVIDSVDVRLGKDKFLESLTEAVPRGLMYRRVTVLHVPDTHHFNQRHVKDNLITYRKQIKTSHRSGKGLQPCQQQANGK